MNCYRKSLKAVTLFSFLLLLVATSAKEKEGIRFEAGTPFFIETSPPLNDLQTARERLLVSPASLILYEHGEPTAQEQYMLELINKARANPLEEAARLGIDLNQGLTPGTLEGTFKPPLAFNHFLIDSSRAHSQWMLDNDVFSHTGKEDSDPFARMVEAGYSFTGSYAAAENIAWAGIGDTNFPLDLDGFTSILHDNLFKSPGHRVNILATQVNEIGIGIQNGLFTAGSPPNTVVYNALMGTQNFARSSASLAPFILGVVYDDLDQDGFYSPGEGVSGVTITTADGDYYAVSSISGGYAIPYKGRGWTEVHFESETPLQSRTIVVNLTGANVHLNYNLSEPEPEPPSIVSHPSSVSATLNQSVLFSVLAIGSEPLSYQWFKDELPILNATNSTYQISAAKPADAGEYWVELLNSAGRTASQKALLTVHIPTFHVRADSLSRPYKTPNPSLTYTITTEDALPVNPSGAPVLTTPATLNSPVGSYPIQVSQGTLDPIYNYVFIDGELTVTESTTSVAPIILTQPKDVTVLAGESASFKVTATGTEPLSYQWLKDGQPIPGATVSALVFFNVLPSDAGIYQVLVSNEAGQTVSGEAQLIPLPRTYLVSAYSVTRPEGLANPPLAYSITDEEGAIPAFLPSGAPYLMTPADLESGVGVYPINVSMGSLELFHNYLFEDATLTVIPSDVDQYYSHGQPTVQEQYMLELINSARSDPETEALRLGVNPEELPSEVLEQTPLPPLAFHQALLRSARGHSSWLLKEHQWSYAGKDGSTPRQRMTEAGYPFSDIEGWACSESLGLFSPASDPASDAKKLYEGLFKQSASCRNNMISPVFEDVGVGLTEGLFDFFEPETLSLIGTIDFAFSGASFSPYITGVIYDDFNQNNAYDLGEGVSGIVVSLEGGHYYTVTSSSGGYALPYSDLNTAHATLRFEGYPLSESRRFKLQLPGKNIRANIRINDPYPEEPEEPLLSWSLSANSLTLHFTGKLQTSVDLLNWQELPVSSPYSIPLGDKEKRFYRAAN